jgi:elongation factor Ts
MVEITAAAVMKLRKMSGQGMMDCKKALGETDGDLDKAMELLRKKGLATLEKRAGRDTTEGRVLCGATDDGKTAVMVSLCCETDFVAKSEEFGAVANKLLECGFAAPVEQDGQALMDIECDGRKFAQILTDAVSKTGEKTEVGDFARYTLDGTGVIGTYVHFNNKVGAMVEVETSSDAVSCAIKPVVDGVCMHITAMNPMALDQDSFDSEVIEKERRIAAEQVKDKPANILEKIIDGKIKKFLKDNCLIEQAFVKDDSKTVSEAVKEAAKAAGGEAKIKRFVRIEIG